MTRLQVWWIRLAASAMVLMPLIGVTRLLWYPGGYSALAGVNKLLLVLVAVSVIIGAGLTTLLYRPGKRGLRLDIGLVAVLELAAVVWAAYEIHGRRPEYTVFAVDRYEVVTAREVDQQLAESAGIVPRPGHTPRLVFAEVPDDPSARSRLIEETVLGGMADIDRRPEFWQPYPNGVPAVLARARPLAELLQIADGRDRAVARWLERAGANAADHLYAPVRGKRRDAVMVVHARTGYPVGIINVDPW